MSWFQKNYLFVALVPLLAFAAFVRLETLEKRPLWYDEIYTANYVRDAGSWAKVWDAAKVDGSEHPPLHYLLSYAAIQIHDSDAFLRLPSVICGILSVLLLALLGRVLFLPSVGLAAGALMTFHPYHINYSLDARPYSLLLCLILGQALAFFLYLQRPRILRGLCFAVCGLAALYTHHTAVLMQVVWGVLAMIFIANRLGAYRQGKAGLKSSLFLAATFVVMIVGYLPQLFVSLNYLKTTNAQAVHTLNIGAPFLHELFARWGAGTGPVRYVYEVFFLLGVIVLLLSPRYRSGILVWLVAPFLFFALQPFAKFFDIRFLIVALPAFYLVVAAGGCSLHRVLTSASRVNAVVPNIKSRWRAVPGFFLMSLILIASLDGYLRFRATQNRCSNFFHIPKVLDQGDGFCGEYIILNSLNKGQEYILKKL